MVIGQIKNIGMDVCTRDSQFGTMHLVGYIFTISYPMRVHGIIDN